MAEKFGLYVLTDIHYLSHKMWEPGKAIDGREGGDQIAIKPTPEIFRSFAQKIIADKEIENVLITGDLINGADMQSHLDFKEELRMLTDAGKKVYVTTATHDYAGEGEDGDENIFHAAYYKPDRTIPAERAAKKDLLPLYYDFGPAQSDSVHESGSYSLPIADGYRLIAINDNGNGRSHCGLFEDGFAWLKEEIRKAKEKGETVFLAVHHPVIPPWEVYRAAADFEMFGGYAELRKIMCEENVRLIFTGHTHVQGIKKYTDENGRSFYDVATSALPGATGCMRRVLFDPEKGTCDISSVRIDKILGYDTKGLSARDYIFGLNFAGLLEKIIPLANKDWDEFISLAGGLFNTGKLNEKKTLVKFGFSQLDKRKMSLVAKLGGKNCGLTKEEKEYLKTVFIKTVVVEVMGHVFSGNGPYTPDTAEYKALTGVTKRADKLMKLVKFDLGSKVSGIHSLTELCIPFLYNNRTGDDDNIVIEI